MATKVALVP